MAVVDAGMLTERVTVQRQTVVPDGAGGESRAWVDADTVWARVIPSRRGDLTAVGEALQGADGFKITVRFRTDIAIDDRIEWRGKVMRVLSANDENGWRQFTTIYTDAGTVTA